MLLRWSSRIRRLMSKVMLLREDVKGARASCRPHGAMDRGGDESSRQGRGRRRRGGQRQGEGEARAATELARDGDLAAVRLHQVLDNGQAQPRAFGAPRARFVGA